MTQKIRNIKSIIIKNFQSHRKTILNLDDGVNVVVGPSDVGKTAILRAIGWVFFNEPSGDAFIRLGEKEASVEIKYNDGFSVKRIRNKSFNGYHINHPDYDEVKKLSGFGSGVPDEVMDITGVRKFQITDDLNSSITYQTQLEGAFLLSQSKDKKAKAIGAISNVNIIDRALKLGKSYSKDYRRIVKESEDEIESIDEKLKEFENLDIEKESLKNIDKIYNEVIQLTEKKDELIRFKNKLDDLDNGIKIETDTINSLEFIPDATNEYNGVNILISNGMSLNRMYVMLGSTLNNISINEEIIEKTKFIDHVSVEQKNLNILIEKYNLLSSLFNNLKRVENEININNKIINESKDIDDYINRYTEAENISNKYNKLQNLNNKYIFIQNQISQISGILSDNKYENLLNNYNYLINKIQDYNIINPLFKSFIDILSQFKSTETYIKNEQKEINDILLKYISILKESKICPLCGAELNEEHMNKIMEEYSNEL